MLMAAAAEAVLLLLLWRRSRAARIWMKRLFICLFVVPDSTHFPTLLGQGTYTEAGNDMWGMAAVNLPLLRVVGL